MWSIEDLYETPAADPAPAPQPPAPAPAPAAQGAFFCAVTPLFQPILHLASNRVIAHEALSRGPRGTPLFEARTLFATARTIGELPALERVCWTAAVLGALRNGIWSTSDAELFINLSPEQMQEPEFLEFARRLVEDTGIDPRRLVVEVTEGSGGREHERFLRAVEEYRRMGFRIAVDDLGVGYADLVAVAEVRPDYLKVDKRLVNGLHAHRGRLDVLHALAALGRAMGSVVIAEGVETAEELEAVRSLGIDCVQGYFTARPAVGMAA